MREREEWRCALEECGGLCVMIAGASVMLEMPCSQASHIFTFCLC